MDPFGRLPPELLDEIFCLLPDLPSLDALNHASPVVFAHLHSSGSRGETIIETIIARSEDRCDEQRGMLSVLRFFIRALVYLWWRLGEEEEEAEDNPFPDSYQAIIDPLHPKKLRSLSQHGYGLTRLPSSVPPHLMCRLLSFSTRLRQIAHICFHEAISQCMSLRPERREGQSYDYYVAQNNHGGLFPRPPGVQFVPQDIGPPSWIEEQRLMEGIVRLFFFFELKRGIRSGTLSPRQPELRSLRLGDLWTDDMLQVSFHSISCEAYKTVSILLKQYCGANSSGDNTDDDDALENLLFSSMIPESQKYCCPRLRHWELDPRIKGLPMYHDHIGLSTVLLMSLLPHSPVRFVEHDYFRAFGLTIWDRPRMDALGFGHDRAGHNLRAWYTFSSILTKEQWEETYRRQRDRASQAERENT